MEVKVLLDSINPYTGTRLTTLHCVYPQFIHQQMLTHRAFSRNASSLRAISFNRAIDEFDVVYPTWTQEKKGMQGEIVENKTKIELANKTIDAMYQAVSSYCEHLSKMGIHHQDINNYLRPFQNIHTVISSTDWDNFFEQRLHESTKPDMQKLAQQIHQALEESEPEERDWHQPLTEDLTTTERWLAFTLKDIELISAARLARISYFKRSDDPNKDLELAKKLLKDKHLSPFEHVAFAQQESGYYANFKDWKQLRHSLA